LDVSSVQREVEAGGERGDEEIFSQASKRYANGGGRRHIPYAGLGMGFLEFFKNKASSIGVEREIKRILSAGTRTGSQNSKMSPDVRVF